MEQAIFFIARPNSGVIQGASSPLCIHVAFLVQKFKDFTLCCLSNYMDLVMVTNCIATGRWLRSEYFRRRININKIAEGKSISFENTSVKLTSATIQELRPHHHEIFPPNVYFSFFQK